MDNKTSVYLNLLRIIATMLVFIGHFSYKQFSGGYFAKVGIFSHDAVIIFFVLSGYVIAYVSENKDKNIHKYIISRTSRIYSVLLPAMILTLMLDVIGNKFCPTNYDSYGIYTIFEVIKKSAINLLFLQEIGNNSIRFFSNGVLWSLGYEVIYYILFGLIYYKGKSKVFRMLTLIIMIAFYKVTLLFPIWLLGVLAYKLKNKNIFNKSLSKIIFISTPIMFIMFKKIGLLGIVNIGSLGYTNLIVGDYITSILIFFNILAIKNVKLGLLEKVSNEIKSFADFSFSIYLYHFPILMFLISILNYDTNNMVIIVVIGLFTLLLCFILSKFTEKKKYVYKNLFINIYKCTRGWYIEEKQSTIKNRN